MDKTLPEIIRKVNDEGGVLMYEDEASFQVSGTITRGWIRKGRKNGKEVESKPTRDSVKTFGAVTVSENPKFHFLFTNIYNAQRFLAFPRGWFAVIPTGKSAWLSTTPAITTPVS